MGSLLNLPIHFTRHAKGRMRWRHITREEVDAVLAQPDRTERMDGKLRLTRTIDERRLLVVIAK